MLRKLFLTAFLAGLLLFLAGAASLYWLVVLHPGQEISEANIEKILSRESPVYYADGTNMAGVFFQEAHRQYVTFEQIPKDFINALTAAEDNSFFRHAGVDLPGIARAMLANLRAGRVVQGGSTITQQTAKNLFKRKDRSLPEKLKELLYALKLEQHYSKEKIFEFYANQFYVSGTGHGLGVAARYYFDKDVSDLSPLECAFIAGSVKRPNAYNPFIQKTEESETAARRRAADRTRYVLDQMRSLGMIDADTHSTWSGQEIPFHRGRMFHPLNTVMDAVKQALGSDELEEALQENGIDNVSTSGIRIYTTVDKELQDKALFALRRELSSVDTLLRGYERATVQQEYAAATYRGDIEARPGAFLFGTVEKVEGGKAPEIRVVFSNTLRDGAGIIDQAGLQNLLASLVKHRKNKWAEASARDLPLLLAEIKENDTVYVSLGEKDEETGLYQLDLEKYPRLQGGAIVLKQGKIKAMIGGVENFYYNRALDAKRPMGSAIKPLVYAAALQLGWNNLDGLNNERDVFIYQGQAYFPRPDHVSPHATVSMDWAGVKSENLASVWLLYHLCDRLTPAQFKEVLTHLDLARRDDESYRDYAARIRDRRGILVNATTLKRAAFQNAVREIEPDLIFAGALQELDFLKKLHYGADFDQYLAMTVQEGEKAVKNGDYSRDELELRKNILTRNFLRFQGLRNELAQLRNGTGNGTGGRLYRDAATGSVIFTDGYNLPPNWRPMSPYEYQAPPPASRGFFDVFASEPQAPAIAWDEVYVGGRVRAATLDLLQRAMDREYNRLAAFPPYSEEVLHELPDFRVLAGISYVIGLSRALGIESDLQPVLSFPLGSNVTSLLETARAYEGLTTGLAIRESDDSLAIIDRIEDNNGQILYAANQPQVTRVLSPQAVVAASDILKNVIRFGTGRHAHENVLFTVPARDNSLELAGLQIRFPLLGKTGTANRFVNSAFAGAVPGPTPGTSSITTADGYTVTSYVGFDDNQPMKHRDIRISGAQGALQIWSRIAAAIQHNPAFVDALDLVDLAFTANISARPVELSLQTPDIGQITMPVNQENGMPAWGGGEARVVTFGVATNTGDFQPSRFFQPFWQPEP